VKYSEEDILNEIIIGYRKVIDDRYQYENLKVKYKLPDSINASIVKEVKYFFLNYIFL